MYAIFVKMADYQPSYLSIGLSKTETLLENQHSSIHFGSVCLYNAFNADLFLKAC